MMAIMNQIMCAGLPEPNKTTTEDVFTKNVDKWLQHRLSRGDKDVK